MTQMIKLAGLVVVLFIMGCGGTATVYRGTLSQTQTAGGATSNSSTAGQTVVVYSGGEQGALLLDLGSIVVSMTRAGDALTAGANQAVTQTESNSTSGQTITTGSGTLNSTLSFTLNGTSNYTSGGNTTNATFMLTFSGTKI